MDLSSSINEAIQNFKWQGPKQYDLISETIQNDKKNPFIAKIHGLHVMIS